jgi:adenylate cyclase
MAEYRAERRLAAILAADVAGYSRLMGLDEEGTLARLKAHRRELIDPKLAEHRGRIVKTTGDGMLVEFASVVDAVRCALDVQRGMIHRNTDVAQAERIEFRIGINVGDIIAEDQDVFGDEVNIAARLEGLADPGGICVSARVREDVYGKLDAAFEDIGEQQLKNIAKPVRAYRLRPGSTPVVPERLPPSLSDKPSIAVLPFQNMSGDPEQEYFADGIVEDITTALSRFKTLFVIARNSSFAYKHKAIDARRIGVELGVRYVLEGSVRKGGDRLRITAQLIDTATGIHLWADRYDQPLKDVFAIQDEITTSIVGRIGSSELLAAEHARVSRKPPQSLDAWDCVIRALFSLSKQSESESAEALALLDRALDQDPNYAQALGMKASIIVFRAFQGWEDMGLALAKVEPLIARAIAADSEEPWPYLAQGMAAFAIRDNALAMAALTRAVALNPNFVTAHCLLGMAHAFGGRSTEALACIDYGTRLSPRETGPTDYHLYYAFAYFQDAQYERGLQFAQQAHRMRPSHVYPLLIAAACAGHLGKREAATMLIRISKRSCRSPLGPGSKQHLLMSMPRTDFALSKVSASVA